MRVLPGTSGYGAAVSTADPTSPDLQARAAAAGVATSYDDWAGRPVPVAAASVERVLAALEGPPPPAVRVVRSDTATPGVERAADGTVTITAPVGLPVGRASGGERVWGWQVQLYQLRSARSWGLGDYADLATLVTAVAAQGAGVVLVNPLHAVTPVAPVQPSPYFPSSRRFASQVYVAVDALPEYTAAAPALRAQVDALRPVAAERIDHDAAWVARRAAFALLVPSDVPVEAGEHGREVEGFAVFCALAEAHGADWRDWPEQLRRPGPAAEAAADPDLVRLHRWVQQRAVEQLDAAQSAARAAGMSVGVVHDLAVGVSPAGADAWLLQDDLASGFTTGAPPDSFNQLGQDWALPPLRPDRLAATAYAPFRDVVRAALAHGGGLRIDHVMGLSRLWWVPEGGSAADGTYVHYDAEAMLAIVALEAAAVGALVVGEDLGTVSPEVTRLLARDGVLGSAVLWFEKDGDRLLPPSAWRPSAAASVSTHDLPTAAGFLDGEPVRVRHELGQLAHGFEEEERRFAADRAALLAGLRCEGLLAPADGPTGTPGASDTAPDPTSDTAPVVNAMHRFLARTPSRVVLLAPADAVGDLRQPNLPGTTDEYPNWRLPLADGTGAEVGLEAFLASPATARLAALVAAEMRSAQMLSAQMLSAQTRATETSSVPGQEDGL